MKPFSCAPTAIRYILSVGTGVALATSWSLFSGDWLHAEGGSNGQWAVTPREGGVCIRNTGLNKFLGDRYDTLEVTANLCQSWEIWTVEWVGRGPQKDHSRAHGQEITTLRFRSHLGNYLTIGSSDKAGTLRSSPDGAWSEFRVRVVNLGRCDPEPEFVPKETMLSNAEFLDMLNVSAVPAQATYAPSSPPAAAPTWVPTNEPQSAVPTQTPTTIPSVLEPTEMPTVEDEIDEAPADRLRAPLALIICWLAKL